jgi:lipooligosaccharide transport system permease protein
MNGLALREFDYRMVHYRRNWRGTVVVNVLNPLLFLFALGAGLGRIVDSADGVPYLAFFAPGLLAAATMQTAVIESGRPVFVSLGPRGSYRSATAGPLGPVDVLHGHLLFMAFRVASSALAFVVVLFAFPSLRTWHAVWLVPAALLTGLAFAAPLAAWAATLERGQAIMNFVIMPMYMFSGSFFPVSQLPTVVRWIVYATPLWHGTSLCRGLFVGGASPLVLSVNAGYLTALFVAGLLVARRTFTRKLFA